MKNTSLSFFVVFLILGIGCSNRKENTSNTADSSSHTAKLDTITKAQPEDPRGYSGEFVYDGGSLSDGSGYLYQKLTLQQDKDSVKGELVSAIYLAKSEAGGYNTPDILVTTRLSGLYQEKEVSLDPIDFGATLVANGKYIKQQFMDVFQQDAQGTSYLILAKQGKDIKVKTQLADNPEILFERIK